ncbi:MAG: polysaccharide biosynthesis C-terminal domain-containing protein [Clostridiales bacterium]|jgi:O-antigen/teichoic acid export membrane protein|nr:polysaccharide biosynthesis C-terminal domain-containing protein [Eubacteriales bacterium]MDH7567791.1 polysaccharide biosynthesis C-terminal domain-containing protein [Clostridiales bacterium]
MRSKNYVNNLIAGLIEQAVTIGAGIFLPYIILTVYGSEINGLLSSIKQIVQYLSLVDTGLAGAVIYALYKPIAAGDNYAISRVVSASRIFYNQVGSVCILFLLIIALVYPFIIKINPVGSVGTFCLTVTVGCTNIVDFFLLAKYNALCMAAQKYYYVTISRCVGTLVYMIVLIVSVISGMSIVLAMVLTLVNLPLRYILIRLIVKYNFPHISFTANPDYSAIDKRNSVFLQNISSFIATSSPIVILTMFGSLTDVSIYTVYNIIFFYITSFVGIFTNSLTAGFGDVIAKGEYQILQSTFKQYLTAFYALLIWVFSCALLLGNSFIRLYTKDVTDANYVKPVFLVMIAISNLLMGIKMPGWNMIYAAGHYKQTNKLEFSASITTVIISLIMVKILGIYGVVIGTTCGNLIYAITGHRYTIKNIVNISMKDTVVLIIRIPLIGLLVSLPFLFIKISINNFLEWFIQAIFISLWAAIIVFTVTYVFDKDGIKALYSRIKQIKG